jgi:hypothetical protein
MSTNTGIGAQSRLDFTMMYAAHDAFRRDTARLARAADSTTGDLRAFRAGWTTFTYYLHVHHSAEDSVLWPPLRAKMDSAPERLALLDAMEAEHASLDPLMARIGSRLTSGDTGGLRADAEQLDQVLTDHLAHEENDGLPLIDAVLNEKDWDAFGEEQRRQVGTAGTAQFFPWLLDEASAGTEQKVLALVPPPIRFLYRKTWRPRYQKRSPWGQASRA